MTRFDECLAALGSYKIAKLYEAKMARANLPLNAYGQLELRRCRGFRDISAAELSRLSFTCYIIFGGAELPVIRCDLKRAADCLKSVLAVSPTVWLMAADYSRVVEICGGRITLAEI